MSDNISDLSRHKCVIIGSGPAGYTAAIYTSRANLAPVVYEGLQPGGQLTTTSEVENFPGYPDGVMGDQLMMDLRNQALRFGADIRTGVISKVDFSVRPFRLISDSGEVLLADAVIIATGASARYLGLPDEVRFSGMGVSACATCDGFFYRGRQVAVVGGGDTACEEAYYLSNIAQKVYMIVRKGYLRASKVMQERVMQKDNIEILFNTNTESLFGEDYLEGARLVENVGTDKERRFDICIEGFFLAIGHKPNTDFLKGQVELDDQGYIVLPGRTQATTTEGVFAAGDVADSVYQQAITAAGTGCRAALDVEHFLMTHNQ